jgi:hypothetical protein
MTEPLLRLRRPSHLTKSYGLWSWLALFYFDQLCKPPMLGNRKPLEDAVYLLEDRFSFRRCTTDTPSAPLIGSQGARRACKSPANTSGKGTRTDIAEQLGAYQHPFRQQDDHCVCLCDVLRQGSTEPRAGWQEGWRLGTQTSQHCSPVRTDSYDLQGAPIKFLTLLPREFKAWVRQAIWPPETRRLKVAEHCFCLACQI